MGKFRAERCEIDGIKFASKLEGAVYAELRIREKGGLISELKCHPRYKLEVNGVLVCSIVPDFTFLSLEEDGFSVRTILEVKGYTKVKSKKTGKLISRGDTAWRIFKLRWDLMKALFPAYRYQIVTRNAK